MQKTAEYVFSGSLTDSMVDFLLALPNFEPLYLLTTQIDWSSALKNIERRNTLYETADIDPETGEHKKSTFGSQIMIDSGAFSIHSGNFKQNSVEEFLEDYYNKIRQTHTQVDWYVQVDKIPGKLGQPKSPKDYEESAEASWAQYLDMRTKIPCPEKILPVFHMGEDPKYLKNMLEWRDENGQPIQYICLSPANDRSADDRMIYLRNMMKIIKASSNPDVKLHLLGFVAPRVFKELPVYSCDAVSYRTIAGAYCKIYSRSQHDIISVSRRPRTTRGQSSLSFIESADEIGLAQLRAEGESYGFTPELIKKYLSDSGKKAIEEAEAAGQFDWKDGVVQALAYCNCYRTVWNVKCVQAYLKNEWRYQPEKVLKKRQLFSIPGQII